MVGPFIYEHNNNIEAKRYLEASLIKEVPLGRPFVDLRKWPCQPLNVRVTSDALNANADNALPAHICIH